MLNDLLFRLRALFRRSAVEAELDDQLRAHLKKETDKHVAAGVPKLRGAHGSRSAGSSKSKKSAATRAALAGWRTYCRIFATPFEPFGSGPGLPPSPC
jgi:hypothetical protein